MPTPSLRHIIALPLLPEVGIRTAKQLIAALGSAEAVFEADRETLIGVVGERIVDGMMGAREEALRRADDELRFVEQHDIRTFYYEDADYPESLRQLPDSPILLYGKGRLALNEGHPISVIGTRMPTDRGKQWCHDLIAELAQKVPDAIIVSGLAYGIDITAHRAALEAGLSTFVIPAHGLDRCYPAAHRQVALQAMETGGILTEYMSGTEPERQNFVARNRIVAGIAEATLVIESKERGGSLITAHLAENYHRPVFAIPGRLSDPLSAGCNALIREGRAQLITSADDIIQAMHWQPVAAAQQISMTALLVDLTPEEQAIMSAISEDGTHINDIVATTGQAYAEVSALLFGLELKGVVRAMPGSLYRMV